MGYELNNFTGLLMNFAWDTENQSVRGSFVNLFITFTILFLFRRMGRSGLESYLGIRVR
jgi:hypothetical protein